MLLSSQALGQDPTGSDLAPSAAPNSSPGTYNERITERTETSDPLEVSLILVGEALPLDSLVGALGSDIPEGLHLTALQGTSFDETTFLDGQASGPRRIEVWVDAAHRKQVRLYFADAHNSRYALRNLELSGQMNEMDLEILAQAIVWSLRAFTEGSGTLSRAEVLTRLEPDRAQPAPVGDTPPKHAPWFSSRRSFFTDVHLFYRVGLYSSEIPLVHGPGLGMGVARSKGSVVWGLDISAQWQVPTNYEQDGLRLQITSLAPRAHLQALVPVSRRLALGAQLGSGVDVIWAGSQARDDQTYISRGPVTSVAVPLGLGVLAQLKLAPHLVMSFQADLEVYVSAPRFEFTSAGAATSFVSPFPVRPTFAIGLGLL